MCYKPITIINPSKYVDISRNDRFLLQVPCGQCVECQKSKSQEWNYRTYYEFVRTFEEYNGYCYFDTLTYDDGHLPRMNEVLPELPAYPCFRSSDITKFLKRVRRSITRKFGVAENALAYFICSEYGSLRGRPHYHLLFFVRCDIPPFELSKLVSQCWQFGRTDGIPYRSAFYVERHNVLKNKKLGDILACTQYVTKYVEKDCKLQDVINQRIKQAEVILSKRFAGMKSNSVKFKKMLSSIAREVNQFHLQSLGYGELALRDIDIEQLSLDGTLMMPSHKIISRVALPTYYARKLFYDRIQINGAYGWQLNELGKEYRLRRKPFVIQRLVERLSALNELAGTSFDVVRLADYVINCRGRFRNAIGEESTIEERLPTLTHYVYCTQSDKEAIGCGVSLSFLGNSQVGYVPFNSSDMFKFKDFIAQYVFLDEELENQLKMLTSSIASVNDGKQLYYSRCQELKATFKSIESL